MSRQRGDVLGLAHIEAARERQAAAYHCSRLGIPVKVVMPEDTPLVKVLNSRRFGAEVRCRGTTLIEALVEARRLEHDEEHVLVHAFVDERVIAGQRTIGLELLEQLPELTAGIER